MEDRRSAKRISVKFRAQFTPVYSSQKDGVIADLTIHGCRIESDINYPIHTYLELHLFDSLTYSVLIVNLAAVRWVKGENMGIEFLSLQSNDRAHLQEIIERTSGSIVH